MKVECMSTSVVTPDQKKSFEKAETVAINALSEAMCDARCIPFPGGAFAALSTTGRCPTVFDPFSPAQRAFTALHMLNVAVVGAELTQSATRKNSARTRRLFHRACKQWLDRHAAGVLLEHLADEVVVRGFVRALWKIVPSNQNSDFYELLPKTSIQLIHRWLAENADRARLYAAKTVGTRPTGCGDDDSLDTNELRQADSRDDEDGSRPWTPEQSEKVSSLAAHLGGRHELILLRFLKTLFVELRYWRAAQKHSKVHGYLWCFITARLQDLAENKCAFSGIAEYLHEPMMAHGERWTLPDCVDALPPCFDPRHWRDSVLHQDVFQGADTLLRELERVDVLAKNIAAIWTDVLLMDCVGVREPSVNWLCRRIHTQSLSNFQQKPASGWFTHERTWMKDREQLLNWFGSVGLSRVACDRFQSALKALSPSPSAASASKGVCKSIESTGESSCCRKWPDESRESLTADLRGLQ